MKLPLPRPWQAVVGKETKQPYFLELSRFLAEERARHVVYPPENEVFSALQRTPYPKVKVFLLGQDPYHDENQAHGLAFSVRPGIKLPPSLRNIFKELRDDLGIPIPKHGCLTSWADQGVLLLNAVLTVRAHQPGSHKDKGWEMFTDAVLSKVNDKPDPVVFVLWGSYARKKAALIDAGRHQVVQSAHPSPLSARHGFFGSKPFSAVNHALAALGKELIDWQLPDVPVLPPD